MSRFWELTAVALLLITAGCGAGSNQRQLQSITLTSSPSGADVQFVATGHYNEAPLALSPLPVLWAVYLTGGEAGPTITQDGLAHCTQGVPGTFTIIVEAPTDPGIPISQIEFAKSVVPAWTTITCP